MPISGTVIDIYLDLRDTSRNTAWVLTTDSIWRTRNLRSNRPSWVEKTAVAVFFPSALGTIIPKRLVGSPASNSLYCLIYVETGAGTDAYEQYVVSTVDDGGSWDPVSTGFWQSSTATWAFPADAMSWNPFFGSSFLWDSTVGHDALGSIKNNANASEAGFAYSYTSSGSGGLSGWMRWHLGSGSSSGAFYIEITYTTGAPSTLFVSNPPQDTWVNISKAFDPARISNSIRFVLYLPSGVGSVWLDDATISGDTVDNSPPATGVVTSGWSAVTATSAIAVGRHDPLKVYLGSASKIFRSTDGAATFSEYIASLGAYDIVCPHQGNAADNNILFIGGDGKIYFSSGATPGAAIMGTAENPVTNQHGRLAMRWSDSSKIYALIATAADTFKIIRTADTGSNWSDGATDLTEAKSIQVYQFGPSAIATQRLALLASLDAGLTYDILRSLDGGENLSSGIGNYGTFDSPVAIAIG